MQIKTLLFFLLSSAYIFPQKLSNVKKLSSKLNEISGLEYFTDSSLIALNDGGNKPVVYILNIKGEIVHEVEIENATNIDWEDITIDSKGNIYIADFGNNHNKRKDLCIYKFNSDSLLLKNKIKAQKITFSFPEQIEFPPKENQLNFDAEALAFYQDELILFTKCRTIPFNGITNVYKLPTLAGNYSAERLTSIQLRSRSMKLDAVTSVDFKSDTCYILTYSGIEIFLFKDSKFTKIERKSFKKLTQKESICIQNNVVFIADEKYKSIFDAKLYKLEIK